MAPERVSELLVLSAPSFWAFTAEVDFARIEIKHQRKMQHLIALFLSSDTLFFFFPQLTPAPIPECLAAAYEAKGEYGEAIAWFAKALDGLRTSGALPEPGPLFIMMMMMMTLSLFLKMCCVSAGSLPASSAA
eukprot:3941846-Rhodomonas_salina.2